ncbi:MAG TPA: PAS domain-containing sensor histidine kinase [Actinomycetota bacterium]|nr:PAS domain-containing sensor histidine kinase [Actinomycetota bacterium]
MADAAARGRAVSNQLIGDLAVPMVAPTGVMGVLYLERSTHPGLEGWESEEWRFAEQIAHEAALALQAAHLYERALSEKEKSKAILDRVADAVVVTDASGTILQWNPAAERTFGRPAGGALGGRCGAVLDLRTDDRELVCTGGCPLLELAGTDPGLGTELWRQRGAGDRQPLIGTAQAVRDSEGKISEVVHSFRDITRLKEADEAKALFLATASHELKTPLTVIQGFAQTLLRSAAPDGLRDEALRAIERRAIELDGIVNRLLLSSRIEAGRMILELSQVEIDPIVSERVAAFSQATGRAVGYRMPGEAPRALADPSGISIVVDHLLDNAIKYSPGGEPVIVTVRVHGEAVEIVVTDQGIGMDAEQVLHCFDKFWQAESRNDRRFGGTGIGLFIVRSLVDSMRGSIRVRSEPGEGSEFTISLKPADGREAPAATEQPAEPAPRRGVGEASVIREFMRQIGVPVRREQ